MPSVPSDESLTFRWFVKERYIPMRQGKWSPAYKKTNTYQLEHYLIAKFGDLPLRKLDSFQIQIWLNGLAERYSESVVRSCFSNIRAITAMARKQKFLTEDPGEDVKMPQTNAVEKPVMTQEQILAWSTPLRTCTISVCFRWESSAVLVRVRSWGCNGSPGRAKHCCPTGRPMRGSSLAAT
jgi:hypothetical protein